MPGYADGLTAQAQVLKLAGRAAECIVDGGACVGDPTAAYLAAFPTARLWAFEPTPAAVAELAARYRGEPRVTVVPAALAAAVGSATLSLNDAAVTNSLLPLDPQQAPYLDYPVSTEGTVIVPTIDLDTFCSREGIDHLSILKLDVQGAEQAVLSGATRLLTESRIDLVFTEFNIVSVYRGQTTSWTLLEQLAKYGYQLFDLYHHRWAPTGQLKWGDALFLSSEIRQRAGI
jgi:FkbM family methyltransferase